MGQMEKISHRIKYKKKGKFQTSFTIITVCSFMCLLTDIDVKRNV